MADTNTSLTLLERVRANEPSAWDRLMALYTPLVRYWCSRARLIEADIEDTCQEVFQAALTSISHFRRDRPGDTFRGWLRGITRNQIALYFRRSQRQPRGRGGSSAFLQLQELEDPQNSPEHQDLLPDDDNSNEVQWLYRRALELVRNHFEESSWQMFWLTVVENKSPTDVAQQLGVTPAAVRKAKSRVLHRLKEELGEVIT